MGLPGDTVEVRDDRLFINGQPVPFEVTGDYNDGCYMNMQLAVEQLGDHEHQVLACPYPIDRIPDPPLPGCNRSEVRGYVCGDGQPSWACSWSPCPRPRSCPPGMYLMIGDNRDNSEDGRVLGLRSRGSSGRQSDPNLVQLGPAALGRADLEPDRPPDRVRTARKREVSMHSKQRGVTMIGWIFLLIPIAIVGYAGIRLAPIYLNYMKVARSLEQTAKQHASDGDSTNQQDIRNTLEKHFDIESVDFPKVKRRRHPARGPTWVDAGRLRGHGAAVRPTSRCWSSSTRPVEIK